MLRDDVQVSFTAPCRGSRGEAADRRAPTLVVPSAGVFGPVVLSCWTRGCPEMQPADDSSTKY